MHGEVLQKSLNTKPLPESKSLPFVKAVDNPYNPCITNTDTEFSGASFHNKPAEISIQKGGSYLWEPTTMIQTP